MSQSRESCSDWILLGAGKQHEPCHGKHEPHEHEPGHGKHEHEPHDGQDTIGTIAYVHDLQGDEDPYTVARLYKRAMRIGKELKVSSAIISIDIDRKDLFEMYARAGFRMTLLWLQKDFDNKPQAGLARESK